MRVVIQRVRSSSVRVQDQIIGQIGPGLNLLVGIAATDTELEIDWMAQKCLALRIFSDDQGRMSQSIQDIAGELIVISQFTLYGDCRKGRRPSFDQAASPIKAEQKYNRFVDQLSSSGLKVETGKFGAMMQVSIENDGPVTLIVERDAS